MSDLTQTFAALADPTRLAIVERLIADGPQNAGSLGTVAEVSAPAISRHLKILRNAGVIDQKIAAQQRIYSARPEAIRTLFDWTMDRRQFWLTSLDRLARALDGGEETWQI